jgi:hypothetical protein
VNAIDEYKIIFDITNVNLEIILISFVLNKKWNPQIKKVVEIKNTNPILIQIKLFFLISVYCSLFIIKTLENIIVQNIIKFSVNINFIGNTVKL